MFKRFFFLFRVSRSYTTAVVTFPQSESEGRQQCSLPRRALNISVLVSCRNSRRVRLFRSLQKDSFRKHSAWIICSMLQYSKLNYRLLQKVPCLKAGYSSQGQGCYKSFTQSGMTSLFWTRCNDMKFLVLCKSPSLFNALLFKKTGKRQWWLMRYFPVTAQGIAWNLMMGQSHDDGHLSLSAETQKATHTFLSHYK